ncbi:MAG: LuxR C-terminal-related transcriptional regulator [Salinivirgaceae bacterium]|jgi:DNA-binding CsgD family transcriptional regulator|nr:LuxR C-terminal-related transcriptional regulator [Salinivirgaceae bacterium]
MCKKIYFKQIFLLQIGFFILLDISVASELPIAPFLKNYSKIEYKAGTQNWDIIQADNNVMYFANNDGILKYDGNSWQLRTMPNHSIVRSLCQIGKDSILAGAFSEFGLVYTDSFGKMAYDSWIHKVPNEYRKFHEVWRIYKDGERIYIQTFSHLLVFYKGEFEQCIMPQGDFKYIFNVKEEFYIQDYGFGLYKMNEGTLHEMSGFATCNDIEIWEILPHENGLLICTQLEGLFLKDKEGIKPWKTEANSFVLRNNLFSALQMKNGNYVFGSIQNGFIITNPQGEIISSQNSVVGLQNNTVLCLFEDNTRNLWIGLDNGIDFAKTNSPLFHVRKRGGFGMGYSAEIYNNRLYVGTNQGLYYIPYTERNEANSDFLDFLEIKAIKGQVWKLVNLNSKLFCCHNLGLYVIDNKGIKKIFNLSGVWDITEIPDYPDLYLIGTYQGFFILNKKTNEYSKLSGFNESARHFIFDNENNILVSHANKGIYKLDIAAESYKVILSDYYHEGNKLPNDFGNEIFKIKNNIIVTSNIGVYNYNGGDFTYDKIWDDFFPHGSGNMYSVIECTDSRYFCFKEGGLYLITWLNNDMYAVESNAFASLTKTFPKGYENVLQLRDNSYLIGNEDGFVLYLHNSENESGNKIWIDLESAKYLSKISNDEIAVPFSEGKDGIRLGELSYKMNNLKLNLSMPYYSNQNMVQFRYRLNNGPWSSWYTGNELNLNSLREGDYVVDIQCTIDRDQIVGKVSLIISIEPPLYRRWYSYLFYLIFFFASTLISSFLIKKRINNVKRRESIIQQKRMIENRIKLKRKAELAQAELTNLRNEKLKTDVRHKSKELANTTMSIIQKNQILQQIKDVLQKLGKNDVKYSENKDLYRLVKKINKEIEHQDNWTVFEKNFDKVHENFLQRLKEKHSELTPKDLRLAAYLRMNLSSKEIAPLLNISVRSVEISRYRLRKKMDLPHDQNLTEYIIET